MLHLSDFRFASNKKRHSWLIRYAHMSIIVVMLFQMSFGALAKDGLMWVLCGDSITSGNKYSLYIEGYYVMRYPQYAMHFRSVGRSGGQIKDMIQDGSYGAYYESRAYAFSPDIVSIMFGHNDASYGQAGWTARMEQVIDTIDFRSSNTTTAIPLGGHPKHGSGKGYLEGYNDSCVAIGARRGIPAADN